MQIRMNSKIIFFIIGVLGGLAFPPFNVWVPLISVLSLSLYLSYMLYLIETSKTSKQAFWRMFYLTEISYLIAFSWIMKPFYFLPNNKLLISLMASVGVFLFTFFLTLFIEFSGIFTFRVGRKNMYFVFALSIAFFEWIRGWIFTGLPWNQFALVWSDVPLVMQVASLIGPFGLSFLTVFVLSFPYLIFYKKASWRNHNLIAVFIIVLSVVLFGWWRLEKYENIGKQDFKVRLVDANIPQEFVDTKYAVERYFNLVKFDGWDDIDLFVLPETSSPFDLTNNGYYQTLYAGMNNDKSSLVVGFNRYDNFNPELDTYDIYNSFAVMDRGGIKYVYDKRHLVPFGEYIPFKKILPFQKFTAGMVDFSEGDVWSVFNLKSLNFLPLICYEVIFSGLRVEEEVDAIVNISNDAWFGEIGKYQHLEIAKFRAVEEGVPVIRVSNDGAFSGDSVAVISPLGILEDGVEVKSLKKFDDGSVVKDFVLPERIGRTFYSKTGNWGFLIFCFVSFIWLFFISKHLDFTRKK